MSRTVIHIEPWSLGVTDKSPVRLLHLQLPLHAGAAGRLFGFVEAPTRAAALGVANIITDATASLPPARTGTTLADRLSVLLAKINRELLSALAAGTLDVNTDALTILLGGAHKTEVAFSGRGPVHALFMPAPKSNVPASDLMAKPAAGSAILPSLTSGTVGAHDLLMFAPHRLMDYISPKLLQSLLIKKDVDQRAALLGALQDIAGREALYGILLRAKPEAPPRLGTENISPQASVNELLARTRATEKLLSTNLVAAFFGWINLVATKVRMGAKKRIFVSTRARLALAGIGVLLIAFVIATFIYTGSGGGPRARALVAEATKKLDDAEAALLYGEETRAWEYLNDADAILAKVRTGTEPKKRAEEFRRTLRHEFVVAEPTLLGDLRNVKEAASGAVLLKAGDALIAGADGPAPFLVSFDPERRRFGDAQELANAGAPLSALTYRGAPIVLTDKGALVTVTRETPVALPIVWRTPEPQAIALYNDRLYSLHPDAGAIDRYAFARIGFASGTVAIGRTDALKETAALAIDGTIFAAATSTVRKFAQGRAQSFVIKNPDPPLTQITKSQLSPKRPELALLIPETKRLVIINKNTGAVIAQYTSDKFDALRDFVIDEAKKHIYLLNGSQIFAIPAIHLQ